MPARDLPTGTITFLFSDIEGSTRLVQELGPNEYGKLLEEHQRIIRAAIATNGGIEQGTEGDSFVVIYRDPGRAAATAIAVQRQLAAAEWPPGHQVRVRIGLHTGQAVRGGDEYVGIDINRAARIAAAGHGGQILVSDSTRALIAHALPEKSSFRDLGEHRLKDLEAPEHLFQLDVDGLPTAFPPLRGSAGPGGTRPVATTHFIGREEEVRQIRALLGQNRLLTLVGPGGTGKTRLMLRVAEDSAPQFTDGTFLVELAPIAEPRLVAGAIAAALGVQQVGDKPVEDVLADFLRTRHVRLLIDNFEHVIEAAMLVEELLRSSPGLQVIATSQVQLNLSGEQLYPVPPLSLPSGGASAAESDAVRLFADRAAQSRPDFRLTPENAGLVAAICQRLDGLPLAIELAAARVRILGLEDILARLDDAIGLLTSSRADLPERHRTLKAAIDWSYGLLNAEDARLFRRLAVFAGGASLDAVEVVAEAPGFDALASLDALVAHSLILADTTGPASRFAMLQTIRDFARERLDQSEERDEALARHALWCCELAEKQESALALLRPEAIRALEPELENFRAALHWCGQANQDELGLRICGSTWRFWKRFGYLREALATTRTFIERAGSDVGDRYRLRGLAALGSLAYWFGDLDLMRDAYQQRLALAEVTGELSAIGDAHFDLIFAWASARDIAKLQVSWTRAREAYEAVGDRLGLGRCAWIESGMLRYLQGLQMDAERLELQILPVFREANDAVYVGLVTGSLAWDALANGDVERSRLWARESISAYLDVADVANLLVTLEGAALTLRGASKPDVAAQIEGAYESLSQTYGVRTPPGLQSQLEGARSGITPAFLDEETEAANREAGRRLTLQQAIDLVLQEI